MSVYKIMAALDVEGAVIKLLEDSEIGVNMNTLLVETGRSYTLIKKTVKKLLAEEKIQVQELNKKRKVYYID